MAQPNPFQEAMQDIRNRLPEEYEFLVVCHRKGDTSSILFASTTDENHIREIIKVTAKGLSNAVVLIEGEPKIQH